MRIQGRLQIAARAAALAVALTLAAAAGAGGSSVPARIVYVTGAAGTDPVVVAAHADGGDGHRLGPGDTPVISPSGVYVAAVLEPTRTRPPSVVLYRWTGAARARTLISGGDYAQPLGFSVDSRYLAVSLGDGRLFTINVLTGARHVIAHGFIEGASWSPTLPDRVVYSRAASELIAAPSNIYLANADGSHTKQLTHDGESVYPVWGPRQIVFSHEQPRANDAPVYQLWLMNADGGSVSQLTNLNVPSLVDGLTAIQFSSDGTRLLAEFVGEDTSEAWTVSVPSGAATELNGTSSLLMAQGLSRDGSTVLATEGPLDDVADQVVVTVPFAGGNVHVIAEHAAFPAWNR